MNNCVLFLELNLDHERLTVKYAATRVCPALVSVMRVARWLGQLINLLNITRHQCKKTNCG